ncbi:hypothetical protein QZH41_015873 [Actinostola sp. cb2023]|nr:hypothetical protein QZH41_015873 [Actinostola sp. cb2023]
MYLHIYSMNEIIRHYFEAFLLSRLPQQTLDVVDDIVLDYLTSVSQSIAEDDSTNVDDFIDIMNAYIPGFSDIQRYNFSSAVESLCELFPTATQLEARRCLMVANGNVNEAARLMLLSRESCDEDGVMLVDSNPKPHQPSAKHQDINEMDQNKIKNQLISRYGLVDVESDQQIHQPLLTNKEEKKLVRYRDNHVVSTKGERFTMVKKQESEDEKKTYVNLKPARKYRFH